MQAARLISLAALLLACACASQAPAPSGEDGAKSAKTDEPSPATKVSEPELEPEPEPEPAGPSAEARAWVEAARQVAAAYGDESSSCEDVAARLEAASEALSTLAKAADAVAVEVADDPELGPELEAAMEIIVSGRLRCANTPA